MRTIRRWLSVILLVSLCYGQADFGDAPDPGYPTLKTGSGPYHTLASASTFWIGGLGTGPLNSTTMEVDASVPNLDYDDGQPYLGVVIMGIPASAWVTVPITTSPSHAAQKDIFINVVVDVDNDGDFDDAPDVNWVVQNQIVRLAADTTLGFVFGPFGFGRDLLLFPVWLRVTVTEVPVPSPWNGRGKAGGWTYGETEDWYYRFNPGKDDGDGGGGGKAKKCARVRMPRIVYVLCDQTRTFKVTVKNCGGIPLSTPKVTFAFQAGTPLPAPPALVPPPGVPASLASGKAITYSFTVTGWPCDKQCNGQHWAWYRAKLSYDPPTAQGDLYYEQEFDLYFKSNYDPYIVNAGKWELYLGVDHAPGEEESPPWDARILTPFAKHLFAFTGHYPFAPFARWVNGHAILTPVHLPSWLTLQKDFMSTDTTFYTLNGVPGFTDNGPDSAVFIVETDDPAVDGFIKRWKYSIPIFVENENQPPFFVQPGPDSVVTHSPLQLFKKTVHLRDSDQQAGKRDTLFIGYELRRLGTAAAFQPVLEPVFFDSGNGSAAFAWTPQPADAGHYRLVFFGWDYYQGLDSLAVDLHVTSATGIERTAELPVHFELYQNSPNPFNARTTIRYDLPQAERVLLRMFNERGQLVATLVSGQRAPGSHVINWDTTEMSSGIYYYVLTAGNYRALRKCVLLK